MNTIKFTPEEAKKLEYVLGMAVGFPVVICQGTGRNNEIEWQIMPEDEFKSGVEGFWNWHAENNENWFETPITAAADFAAKYRQWCVSECTNDMFTDETEH